MSGSPPLCLHYEVFGHEGVSCSLNPANPEGVVNKEKKVPSNASGTTDAPATNLKEKSSSVEDEIYVEEIQFQGKDGVSKKKRRSRAHSGRARKTNLLDLDGNLDRVDGDIAVVRQSCDDDLGLLNPTVGSDGIGSSLPNPSPIITPVLQCSSRFEPLAGLADGSVPSLQLESLAIPALCQLPLLSPSCIISSTPPSDLPLAESADTVNGDRLPAVDPFGSCGTSIQEISLRPLSHSLQRTQCEKLCWPF
ncbi:hypothetical protein NE237_024195 [Protea cynaroides]|uniref:Uncharacterized protein n=1 Tax=Protea cynaroides TaxID=273540 RepID=A0A9Q0HFF2_9MAGN|nr:hypothetical protein NE237_024195 [Protea cynaroides]